ncbi:hypothetical protein KGF56_001381 [Candida oxycetoniae]|uniref:Hap4 transcription factor heteromerisation domain-containing protein n=1 Tax=Candida oxycetoniae TaxID=497107 RepID=A0AAI9SZV7_9ASCO|nr:uncharacterized protein KGF56_001381 [Candida oxycetoniae]KAI3405774.2 hypothetical protein KGF56_001381 [Candida oxycetoniae]
MDHKNSVSNQAIPISSQAQLSSRLSASKSVTTIPSATPNATPFAIPATPNATPFAIPATPTASAIPATPTASAIPSTPSTIPISKSLAKHPTPTNQIFQQVMPSANSTAPRLHPAPNNTVSAKLNTKSHIQPAPSKQQQIRHHPIAPKYTRIQPALAPKRVTAALPQQTSRFNPIPNGKISLLMKSKVPAGGRHQESASLNTSKKWVLPPRPRPGRKPTAGECDKTVKPHASKKKIKVDTDNSVAATGVGAAAEAPAPAPAPAPTPVVKLESIEKTNMVQLVNAPETRNFITNVNKAVMISEGLQNGPGPGYGPGSAPTQFGSGTPAVKEMARLSQINHIDNTTATTTANVLRPVQSVPSTSPIKVKSEIKTIQQPIQLNPSTLQNVQKLPTPPPPTKINDPNVQMMDLKRSYLSKLKEQELMRNYIEILTNQIKELSFVQSGVITFDALKTNAKYSPNGMSSKRLTTTLTNSRIDQLDMINNLNDLNKFLNYLTKSSDIIKSVQKQANSVNTSESINRQIDYYLNLRNTLKAMNNKKMNNCAVNANSKENSKGESPTATATTTATATATATATTTATTTTTTTRTTTPNSFPVSSSSSSSFTPGLLQPSKAADLFNDSTFDYDMELQTATIAESPVSSIKTMENMKSNSDVSNQVNEMDMDFFVNENEFLNRLVLYDDYYDNDDINVKKEEMELGKVEIHDGIAVDERQRGEGEIGNDNRDISVETTSRQTNLINNETITKKKLKFNCGFCTKDTPCLCFDSDLELNSLRQ